MADQEVVEDRFLRLRREPGALEAFERKTAWPMLGVVVASLLLLLVPVFVPLSPAWANVEAVAEWTLWLVFLTEYVTRWSIAEDRASFVKHNVVDLVVVVLPMFPMLRAFRAIGMTTAQPSSIGADPPFPRACGPGSPKRRIHEAKKMTLDSVTDIVAMILIRMRRPSQCRQSHRKPDPGSCPERIERVPSR